MKLVQIGLFVALLGAVNAQCGWMRASVEQLMQASLPTTLVLRGHEMFMVNNTASIAKWSNIIVTDSAILWINGTDSDAGAEVVTVTANIFLLNTSAFFITHKAHVDWAQEHHSQYGIWSFDHGSVAWVDASLSYGKYEDLISVMFNCNQATTLISEVTWADRKKGKLAPFVFEESHFHVDKASGSQMEITVLDNAEATLSDCDPAMAMSSYFSVNSRVERPIVLPRPGVMDVSVSVAQANGSNSTVTAHNSNVNFGVWLRDGGDIVLRSSSTLLFLVFAEATAQAPISNIHSGYFSNEQLSLGRRHAARLVDTSIWIVNVYLEGGAEHALKDSVIGETSCNDAGTVCAYHRVTVDGSGGFITVGTGAKATFDESTIATDVFVAANTKAWFVNTDFKANAHKPALGLHIADGALVTLENSRLPLSTNPAEGYQVFTSGTGCLIETAVVWPPEGAVLSSSECENLSLTLLARTHGCAGYEGPSQFSIRVNDGSTVMHPLVSSGEFQARVELSQPLATAQHIDYALYLTPPSPTTQTASSSPSQHHALTLAQQTLAHLRESGSPAFSLHPTADSTTKLGSRVAELQTVSSPVATQESPLVIVTRRNFVCQARPL